MTGNYLLSINPTFRCLQPFKCLHNSLPSFFLTEETTRKLPQKIIDASLKLKKKDIAKLDSSQELLYFIDTLLENVVQTKSDNAQEFPNSSSSNR